MVTILQCKFCNKPFQSIGSKICPNCLDQIDKDFVTIRDYLYDHTGQFDLDAVCEATDVQKNVVLHLINESRLILSTPQGAAFACSVCHKPIASGTMCDECRNSLSTTLSASVESASKPQAAPSSGLSRSKPGGRMHVRGGDNNRDKN